MFDNITIENYQEIAEGIRQKKLGVILYKNDRVTLFTEAFKKNKWTSLLFLLQFLFPILFIVTYSCLTKGYWGLAALPFYVAAPFILPQNDMISMSCTAFGLFGLVWHWPPLAICLLAPMLLYYWGERIWWSAVQLTLVCELIKNYHLFEKLWKKNLLAIHDYQGNIYRYNHDN